MLGMELVKENIECEQLLGENTSDSVIKGEYIIPDTLPDVFEIRTTKMFFPAFKMPSATGYRRCGYW